SADTLFPYDQYHPRLHFCTPEGGAENKAESLGSILFGDRLYNSRFELKMKKDVDCQVLCEEAIPGDDAKFINERIREEYKFNWVVDGLPAAQMAQSQSTNETFYSIGFSLGELTQDDKPVLNNHYTFQIDYHTEDNVNYRVVGFLVWPYSIADGSCNTNGAPLYLDESKPTTVKYTSRVYWNFSSVPWGTRWDSYLKMIDPQIHWFSIINSIVIVFMLTGMIAMILLRALHKDISRYNAFTEEDGGMEDFGWKLVHADVFRPPAHRMFLAVFVGNGSQLFLMAVATLVFAALGFLSPSSRGSLGTVTLIFYVFFGFAAGYVSARLYKMLQGEYWRRNVFLTAFIVPGFVFSTFLILNFFLIAAQSSAAVPFSTMFALISMWFLVSAPLCIAGAYFGFKHPTIENPVKTNQIPRQIPTQPLYLNMWIAALIGGILPFGAIFIELYFIMNSIWMHKFYYVFGFLTLVFSILVVTCAEVSILMCYFHLCSEDYYWSWRAFLTSGASGFYVFLYSVLYYYRKLHIHSFPSTALYFGWSLVMSFLFSILTASFGYMACLLFVRKIFGAIKVD
ncbi:hypothetical protein BJ742DRAFT_819421, partial [Cladochytrium replicatum]